MTNNCWNKIYKEVGTNYDYYDIVGSPHPDLDRVLKYFKKSKVRKVLDLGCGAGRNTLFMAKKGFVVSSIDLAKSGIGILKKTLKKRKLKASLKIGNIFNPLPYPDNYFDAIVSVQVLQHGNEKQIQRTLKEVYRVLNPNGLIFITICGRYSKGKLRYCLVKTARTIAPNTFVPTIGEEKGLTHFIYTMKLIKKHYSRFSFIDLWTDDKGYYCFIAQAVK